jgi:hypothetical protein
MAKKYLHIGVNWVGVPKPDEIQRLIESPNAVEDWFKYGGNCWLVFTQHDQTAWADYLKPHIGSGSLVIYEVVNLGNSNGILPINMWEWFNKVRF